MGNALKKKRREIATISTHCRGACFCLMYWFLLLIYNENLLHLTCALGLDELNPIKRHSFMYWLYSIVFLWKSKLVINKPYRNREKVICSPINGMWEIGRRSISLSMSRFLFYILIFLKKFKLEICYTQFVDWIRTDLIILGVSNFMYWLIFNSFCSMLYI